MNTAANRILRELTGLENIYLRQFHVFGKPDRIKKNRDIEWLRLTTKLPIERVVTIAYYSLINISNVRNKKAIKNNAEWQKIEEIKNLAFDHKEILNTGINTLRSKIQIEPVGMELLPKKFTIRQLQNVYEAILNKQMDNRNFRKKVLKANYLTPLEEKEHNVAHKPARLYSFNKILFKNNFNQYDGFQF